jgi:hypothetical protein
MKKKIDTDIIKNNPEEFFSQLNSEARKEFDHLLNYMVYKYDIVLNDIPDENQAEKVNEDFMDFLKKGFHVSEKELEKIRQIQKDINSWNVEKY